MAKQPITPGRIFSDLLEENEPQAMAWVQGGPDAPYLSGLVKFYETFYGGVLIEAELFGLPDAGMESATSFYGIHIHENGDCSDPQAGYPATGNHYNPGRTAHPGHAGDLPPVLSYQGYAWSSFYDKRLTLPEIIGKSVVIHQMRDDFTSQPSGDSGAKIGCGVIRRTDKKGR